MMTDEAETWWMSPRTPRGSRPRIDIVTDPRYEKYRPKGPACLRSVMPNSRQRYWPGPDPEQPELGEALIGPDSSHYQTALRRNAEAGDRHARLILCIARVFGLS